MAIGCGTPTGSRTRRAATSSSASTPTPPWRKSRRGARCCAR